VLQVLRELQALQVFHRICLHTHPTTVIFLSFASYRLATNFAHIKTDLLLSLDTLSQAQSLTPDIHWDTVFQSFVCGFLITASVSTRTSLTFDPPLRLPSDFVQGSIYTHYKPPYKDLSPFPLVGSFSPIESPTCQSSRHSQFCTPESITPAISQLLLYKFRATSTYPLLTSSCNGFV